MKKIVKFLPIVLAIVLTFSSCKKEDDKLKTLNGTEWEADLSEVMKSFIMTQIKKQMPEDMPFSEDMIEEIVVKMNLKFAEKMVTPSVYTKVKIKMMPNAIEQTDPEKPTEYNYDSASGNVTIKYKEQDFKAIVDGDKMTAEIDVPINDKETQKYKIVFIKK